MRSHPLPSSASSADILARPMAATRPRRTESFRSLRSQGNDGSGAVTSPAYQYASISAPLQPTFSFHHHHHNHPPPPVQIPAYPPQYEIPTAYLDLDLVIIKANASYCQIMVDGREIAGRQLSDIAIPVDGETFQDIRTRLRAEREAREPVYMPPIVQHGQDPLHDAALDDVERLTHGFDEKTYTWAKMGPSVQAFPARVRLAKSSAYFVAITLPSFRPSEPAAPPRPLDPAAPIRPLELAAPPRPVDPAVPSRPASPFLRTVLSSPILHHRQSSASCFPPRHVASQSAPAAGHSLFGAAGPLVAPSRSSGHQATRSYPPPQPLLPYQYQNQPPPQQSQRYYPSYQPSRLETPRFPIADLRMETTAFAPRSMPREPSSPLDPARQGVQLPPILSTPALTNTTRSPIQSGASDPSEGKDGQRSPRKRRRLDIDDVLHR